MVGQKNRANLISQKLPYHLDSKGKIDNH